jgi:hypothetical protein
MFLLLGGMVVAGLKLNVALGAFSIVIGACITATRTSRARTLQKEFAQYPDSSKDLEFEFGENGVLVQSGHAKVEGEWARFNRFAETNDLFVLLTPPRGLTILPKRVLSPSDLDALRELLRRKLPRS